MIKKLTLMTGFAAGYVLGAKAGTERYDQIIKGVEPLLARFKEETLLSGTPMETHGRIDLTHTTDTQQTTV
jgi:hypothetical protein